MPNLELVRKDDVSSFSEKPFQNSSCNSFVSVSSAACTPLGFVSSFGSQTTLNFGAGGESPIRHSSISSAQKFVAVCSFSQSMTLRYSSVTCFEIHTTVCAPRPAA